MKNSRFNETQIVSILKEADAGEKVKDISRRHGISDATYYNWESKYSGMQASELKRLKETEAELSQLKRMYADLAIENTALKDLIDRNVWSTPYLQGVIRVTWNSLRKCIRPLASGLLLQPGP